MTKTPTGQEISVEIDADSGRAELIRGSMRTLKLEDGDLLIVRTDARAAMQHTVLSLFADLVEQTGRRAVAPVLPTDYEIERMPHARARELLETILQRRSNP